MYTLKCKHSLNGERDEIEAMTIIVNIQMMQDKVHGKHFEYYQFNGNTVNELRNLQDEMVKEYNATFH